MLTGAVGIAFAPVLAKLAVNVDGMGDAEIRLSPVAVAFWRMALASPFFWAAAWRQRRQKTPQSEGRRDAAKGRQLPLILALPGLFFAVDLGIWHWSFEFTSVANATLEANFACILVPLVSFLFLGEKFTPIFAVGALIALIGMARLVGFSIAANGDAWIGDLMGLGVAVAYSAYLLVSKTLLRRFPVTLVMASSTTSCAVFLAIGALLTPGRFFPTTAASWGYLVALAVVAQLFGQGLIAFGMSRLPAGFSAVTLVLQPVVATYLSWIMLGQTMGTAQVTMSVAVLFGIVLARFGTH